MVAFCHLHNKETIMNIKYLSIISGKGGAGKTVISLSIAKILSEIGIYPLLIDCDVSTHGATYFYENDFPTKENYIELSDLSSGKWMNKNIFKNKDGFYFIPSFPLKGENQNYDFENIKASVKDLSKKFQVVIFDCQAGYSPILKVVTELTDKNLIVLEADAVSSSALRALYLQLGQNLTNNNTWQIFNKLSEEERRIYENVIGGTMFPSLPPVPFDWKVRASFSLNSIPSMSDKESAYGIAVLRICKMIFKELKKEIEKFEQEFIGNWYEEIQAKIESFEDLKSSISYNKVESKRRFYRQRYTLLSAVIMSISVISFMIPQYLKLKQIEFDTVTIAAMVSAFLAVISVLILIYSRQQSQQEIKLDKDQIRISELEVEINKYRTLLNTDPRLKEYNRIKDKSSRAGK